MRFKYAELFRAYDKGASVAFDVDFLDLILLREVPGRCWLVFAIFPGARDGDHDLVALLDGDCVAFNIELVIAGGKLRARQLRWVPICSVTWYWIWPLPVTLKPPQPLGLPRFVPGICS